MVSRGGSVNPADFPGEDFDLYSIPAYDAGVPMITAGRDIGSIKRAVETNDVLLSQIVPHIRRSWVVQPSRGRRQIASSEWIVFRAPGVHSPYLRHVLLSDGFYSQFMGTVSGVGGSLLRAKPAFVARIRVMLPPIEEQKRIAEVLDRADDLRAKRRQALAHLDQLIASIFLDMFGDPAQNPMGWQRRAVIEVGQVMTGNTPPRSDSNLYGDSIEWIKSDNIVPGLTYLTPASEGLSSAGRAVARVAKVGSVLVTCIAGSPSSIGNAAMADREVAFNQQINAILPSRMDGRFLLGQLLVGKRLVQLQSTGGMKGLVSKSRLEAVSLISPPMPAQQQFSRRAGAVERLKKTQRTQLAELDGLFAALRDRAFAGLL